MSVVGVIAEYNPFHNGHKYLLDEAVKITRSEYSISIMSGNFMQRGTPAIADKYSRAESAIYGGLDAVFELPVLYATGSSRDFAMGGVALMDKMNVVDYIVFGAEDEEMGIFDEVSSILAEEPEEYKKQLNDYISKGLSFPAASEKAIKKIVGESISEIISRPNNILAISYITALKKLNSKIKPIIIRRNDSGYLNSELTGKHSSATAIRNAITDGKDITEYVPKNTLKPYKNYIKKELPDANWLTPYINSRIIYDRNLKREISMLDMTLDMTQEILNRLRKAPLPTKYVELADYLKTKNITMTRVRRILLHMVLGISKDDRELAKSSGYGEYLNLLAVNKKSTGLIKMIEEKGTLTIINKKSEFKPQTEIGSRLWDLDKLSTDIYNQLLYENLNIRNRGELTSTVKTVLP